MKIRTCYFKVSLMDESVRLWSSLLNLEPVKRGEYYSEFRLDNINLGLLLNDFDDKFEGSNCVPVFELDDNELLTYVERAKNLNCIVILDELSNPNVKSVIFSDPWGNEFEFSRFHD